MAVTLHGRYILRWPVDSKWEFSQKEIAVRKIALLTIFVAICGCESKMPRQTFEPVQSGQRISISKPVIIIEKRGPLGISLEWQLLPGDYVERYTTALGRVFESDGPLVQFTPTMGDKTRRVGGFIVLRGQMGVGKLYVVRRGETSVSGPVATSIALAIVGPAGDISLVTDFPLSSINATGWQ